MTSDTPRARRRTAQRRLRSGRAIALTGDAEDDPGKARHGRREKDAETEQDHQTTADVRVPILGRQQDEDHPEDDHERPDSSSGQRELQPGIASSLVFAARHVRMCAAAGPA